MSQEIEYVLDGEVVEEEQGPDWESCVSEWAEGAHQALHGQLRQASAAAAVTKRYGLSSMEAFAKEVGCSRSTAYDYAKVWWTYRHMIETPEFSRRVESGLVSMSQLVQGTRYPEPVAAIDRAVDDGISGRQMERERKEESVPENVETITNVCCVDCGCVFELSRARTWTEER